MQLLDEDLVLSASDLVAFSECAHLAHLELERAAGRYDGELSRDATADLLAKKGDEHELDHLDRLKTEGLDVAEIATDGSSMAGLERGAADTRAAVERGAEIIFQAALLSVPWRGYADFLVRVERPSELGDWSYEVADTKLARRAKPYFMVQLCLYSELLAEVQGVAPERMHVVLGSGRTESHRVDDYAPYVRRLRQRFLDELDRGFPNTYPNPVEHCAVCAFADHCEARRRTDDHLSLVANMRRGQTRRLAEAGVTTVVGLGEMDVGQRPARISENAFRALREQAALQLAQRRTGELRYELLEPELKRGFARLPEPNPGDLVFDIEGDPFYDEEGLEYLFGVGFMKNGDWRFEAFWAHDRAGERRAFERLMDLFSERLAAFPGMHVYHYAPYEATSLKRLMGLHGTREKAVDDMLRSGRLVDLYGVVRQGMRLSTESYSIKKVEGFYGFERTSDVGRGDDSIVAFERYLDSGDESILRDIEAYNEEDCRSTLHLLEWLRVRRTEACERFGEIPWAKDREEDEEDEEPDELAASLTAEIPHDWAPDPTAENLGLESEEQHCRWLTAQLLAYHRREAKPTWWQHFARLEMSDDELFEDAEALAHLEWDGAEPVPVKRSLEYTMRFPAQEHRIRSSSDVADPALEKGINVVAVDDAGEIRITRAKARQDEPLPTALIPGGPVNTDTHRDALRRVGEAVLAEGTEGGGPHRAARTILAGSAPRIDGHQPGDALLEGHPEPRDLADLVRRLDDSALVLQGPPGSGKTWIGARAIVDLLADGLRVGVAATSHKAIHNLLHEIEKAAHDSGARFCGLKKASKGNEEAVFESRLAEPMITTSIQQSDFQRDLSDAQLVAGTSWLFAREDMDDAVDVLVVDEAGQVSLADAIAMATAADRVVLLGDPCQLAHVSQGTHPPGVARSVLGHLLGARATVPPSRGIFLGRTWRLCPDICDFVSRAVYEGRLESEGHCAAQAVRGAGLSGSGVRFLPVAHEGNDRSSPEEAAVIADRVTELLASDYESEEAGPARLTAEDMMVVAPYNAQVDCLRRALPDGVRVGTVDKFQGQEAPVVFFSMTTSSGEDVPRDLAFLLSLNRLNVAVSRARALAIVVASPELLSVRCRSLGDMRLASALCLLAEIAETQNRPDDGTGDGDVQLALDLPSDGARA